MNDVSHQLIVPEPMTKNAWALSLDSELELLNQVWLQHAEAQLKQRHAEYYVFSTYALQAKESLLESMENMVVQLKTYLSSHHAVVDTFDSVYQLVSTSELLAALIKQKQEPAMQ